jgi:hypothetical protein
MDGFELTLDQNFSRIGFRDRSILVELQDIVRLASGGLVPGYTTRQLSRVGQDRGVKVRAMPTHSDR